MDELDMMSLELPSVEGLDDLDNPERSDGGAEGGSVTENAASESGSGERGDRDEDYSYEYEGGELEEMAVPTLSEMDGSELGTFAANAAANIATASLDKPENGGGSAGTVGLSEMSGAPAFSEMSGAPAGGQTGRYGQPGMNGQQGSNATGNNFGNNGNNSLYNSPNNMQNQQNQQGGYGRQNTYAPVNPGSGGMGQSGGSSEYWDNLERDNELVRRGETVAKRVATAVIVLAGLSVLSNLANKDIGGAASAAVDIYLAVKFMQGSHSCRFWLGIFCVINFITSIRSFILIKNISDLAAALGAEVHGLGFFSLYFLIAAVGMLVLAYFFFFNKAIDAYCERYSDRVE